MRFAERNNTCEYLTINLCIIYVKKYTIFTAGTIWYIQYNEIRKIMFLENFEKNASTLKSLGKGAEVCQPSVGAPMLWTSF